MINQTLKECNKIGNAFINQNYKEIYIQLFPDIQKNIELGDFDYQLKEIDKNLGVTNSYLIKGFETKKGIYSDNSEVPFVSFFIDLHRNSETDNLVLTYSLRPDLKGIADFNMNEK